MDLTPLKAGKPALVISHERSGTHFLMNTLGLAFGYVSNPWVDLDVNDVNINYFHPPSIAAAIEELAGFRIANLVKSHHEASFFGGELGRCAEAMAVFYVYRHPAEVMASMWRFVNSWEWLEGPWAASSFDFAQTAPMGRLLRYQQRQQASMLDRWANHVSGWLAAAEATPGVHLVAYEELRDAYAPTVARMSEALGLEPQSLERPQRGVNVVDNGPVPFDLADRPDSAERITELATEAHPELMARLGYLDRELHRARRAAGAGRS